MGTTVQSSRSDSPPPQPPAAAPSPTDLPPQQARLPRLVLVLLGAGALVVAVAGMRSAAGIIGPTILALILAVTMQPVQAALLRRRVPVWLAVTMTTLCAYLLLLGLAAALAYSAAQLVILLPHYSTQFSDLVNQVVAWLDKLGIARKEINTAVSQLDLQSLVTTLQRVISETVGVVSDVLFILLLLFFLILEGSSFPRWLEAVRRQRPELVAALTSFARGTRRYVAVSSLFGLVVALIDVAALYWLGVPLPWVWGLLSFISNYIPNIGFVIGLVPPMLLALLEGGPRQAILVAVAYALINVAIQSLLQPKVVGDAVGLSATVTFLSLVFWAFVLGPLGALLAIPLSLLAKALLIDADPASRWLNDLIVPGARTPP